MYLGFFAQSVLTLAASETSVTPNMQNLPPPRFSVHTTSFAHLSNSTCAAPCPFPPRPRHHTAPHWPVALVHLAHNAPQGQHMYCSHSTSKILLVPRPPSRIVPRLARVLASSLPCPATAGPRGRNLASPPTARHPTSLGFAGHPPCPAAQEWANVNPAIGYPRYPVWI